MAVLQRLSIQPDERFDTPDARLLEAASLNDWRFFLSGFYSPQSLILTGFEISNYNTIFTVPGFSLTIDDVVLFHSQAATQSAGFYVFSGTEPNISVSLSPNATNFVEADLGSSSGTPDVRAFWDPAANSGVGGEFTDTVDTVINLQINVTANITGFTSGKMPLYKVITNPSGIVTSVQDCRNLLFRLGTGGDSPNPANNFSWPSDPDSSHARFETPSTATSATPTNAPFQGGDKNIKYFKQWMDAVMSSLKEIKGTPFWYMSGAAGGGIASAYQNSSLIVFSGGTWQHNPPYLTTTGSVTLGSNQLTGLASTTGIVNGDIVTGIDIPDSPATTVLNLVGNVVTLSANALGTNASESVKFSSGTPGILALSGGTVIHRLGFANNLNLNAFSGINLALHPALYILFPTTDTAISYGFGEDAATPIVPKQVSAVSPTSISVPTGGNYITTGGKVLVHGQIFSYTSYTAGTGLFSGVTPDPSGLVQVGDYVYQTDSGGIGYYHYSSAAGVPGVISGVSHGVERTIWLALFDGANTIELRNSSILPGELINVGDSTIQNIVEYTGMPGEGSTFPEYITTATGALATQTNYNSVAGEDLTKRLSRITSMMADKAQDKTIQIDRENITNIVNTTNGSNQDITFTGGGALLRIAMPGSGNNGVINLGGTLSLAANQAAYFTVNRNASFSLASLASLTVAPISSVPLSENVFIFAIRFATNFVYLWDARRINVGTFPADQDLDINVRARLGILTEDSYEAYTSTFFISSGDSYATAISKLDAEVHALATAHAFEEQFIVLNPLGQTNFTVSSFSFDVLNSVPDITVWMNGQKLDQDQSGTGLPDFNKVSTTQIQLFSAAPQNARITIRLEKPGTGTGGGGGGGDPAYVVSGSIGSPNLISALTTVPVLAAQRQIVFVAGNGGAVTSAATPQVGAGTIVGQELILFGTDDTNTLTLNDGNGLGLNGPVVLKLRQTIYFIWDGSVWAEISRR
jgi:hypothetical protein